MHEPYDYEAELDDVRAQIATSNADVFPPAIVADIDNLRAWAHDEARRRGLDPESADFERTCLIAGAVMGRLLVHPNTATMFAGIDNDNHRGHLASLLMWTSCISAQPSEAAPT
jgi:hypothetical protein